MPTKEINPKSAGEIRICSTKDKPKSNEDIREQDNYLTNE